MIKIKDYPSQQVLKDNFRYCDSGNLYWRFHSDVRVDISKPTGHIEKSGYVRVRFHGQRYSLHRLIYIYHHGAIPDDLVIDHISGDNTDNRVNNLQAISARDNVIKQKKNPNNTSGYRGVCWIKLNNKWRASITVNRTIHIGLFENVVDAAKAYDKAALEYHGEFAQLNFPECVQ